MPRSVDPATLEVLAEYDYFDAAQTEASLVRVHAGARAWASTSLDERANTLRSLAALLRSRVEPLANLITAEMGKPIAEARAEVQKCALGCEHYATQGPALLADEVIATDAARSYVSKRPLGVILAIMPWNFPFWQVFRAGVPALLAGNALLLKHADNTLGCARAIAALMREAGMREGVVEHAILDHPTSAEVIADPRIAGVTLTGSVRAGRAVAALAGAALKKVVLELGGSDPYVILADAELDRAVEICARARLQNSGQTCVAAKRFIVVEAIADAFVERLHARLAAAKVGDGREEGTQVGPLARPDLCDTLRDQVARSLAAGATLRFEGRVPEGRGNFHPVTLLDHVRPGSPAAAEELFGPVAAVMRARDEDEAIMLANASEFGLGAAVFTRDRSRGEAIAREQLDAGCCFVNDMVRSDPRLPFGGVKHSGFGRELGRAGLLEWVNQKTVWVND